MGCTLCCVSCVKVSFLLLKHCGLCAEETVTASERFVGGSKCLRRGEVGQREGPRIECNVQLRLSVF